MGMNRNVLEGLMYSNILQAGIDDDECQDKKRFSMKELKFSGSANIVSGQKSEDAVHQLSFCFF